MSRADHRAGPARLLSLSMAALMLLLAACSSRDAELDRWDDAVREVVPLLTSSGLRARLFTPHRWLSAFSSLNEVVERIARLDDDAAGPTPALDEGDEGPEAGHAPSS